MEAWRACMVKDKSVKIALTGKELNYIEAALQRDIAYWQQMNDEMKGAGNLPHLLWFTKRLRGRLRRIHKQAVRKWIGEKKWKEIGKRVQRMARASKKLMNQREDLHDVIEVEQ